MLATEDWKKIFSRHSKSSVTSTEMHFLKVPKWSKPLLPLRAVWKLKNHRHLTFEIIESVRVVVWHFRLFLRIAMILRMLASTHVGYWRLKYYQFCLLYNNMYKINRLSHVLHDDHVCNISGRIWLYLYNYIFLVNCKSERKFLRFWWFWG